MRAALKVKRDYLSDFQIESNICSHQFTLKSLLGVVVHASKSSYLEDGDRIKSLRPSSA